MIIFFLFLIESTWCTPLEQDSAVESHLANIEGIPRFSDDTVPCGDNSRDHNIFGACSPYLALLSQLVCMRLDSLSVIGCR